MHFIESSDEAQNKIRFFLNTQYQKSKFLQQCAQLSLLYF